MTFGAVILTLFCAGSVLQTASAQSGKGAAMETIRVRYFVNNIDQAVSFYTKYLEFRRSPAPRRISQCFREGTWNWS